MQSVTRWLKRKLELKVNPKKSSTKKATGLKFLGLVSMDYRIRKLTNTSVAGSTTLVSGKGTMSV
ncbi:hypothetical protein OAO01_03340 [Oligoflexia bacterium]|nr:hypothetical protein [Oligoflexia bacterium]